MTATKNVLVVYHLNSEQVRMIVKDASDPNDPAWQSINEDPDGHAMMHIEPQEYNAMNHWDLQAHHARYIPLHKTWYLADGHRHKRDQVKAKAEFSKFLAIRP